MDTLDGVEGLMGDRGFAVGRGIDGARPKLELGLELYAVETPGLWYRSGEVRLEEVVLWDMFGSVWGLFLIFTVAFRVGVRPMNT